MNNSEITKGKSVKKFLDRAFRNGWKIAKRIDFPNTDMYNYHLVPVNGGDGYICMWCEGNEFAAQYNEERYTDLYNSYKGETLYETGYNKSTLYMGIQFKEV